MHRVTRRDQYFTFKVSDAQTNSNTATVNTTVHRLNDAQITPLDADLARRLIEAAQQIIDAVQAAQ